MRILYRRLRNTQCRFIDPNRADDPQYIVRLIGKVISVSLETVKIVAGLPQLGVDVGAESEAGELAAS